MIKTLLSLSLFTFVSVQTVFAADIADSVVKIFTTSSMIDFFRPWQNKGNSNQVGSGSIIKGNKILTNAHVVSNHTFVQVKKRNDSKKFTAKVEIIGHDCDLAILSVDDPEFFEGTKPIEIEYRLPKLQDSVTVLGYPKGGGKLSITEGVISRIEVNNYSISARRLLTVQIDAAINPGNSGGPVIFNGKLIGVAMQVLNSAQNIGYMIPAPIIKHFFKDIEDDKYDGFPLLGIEYSSTENETLREYYGFQDLEGGVLVNMILPNSSAEGILKENDVILEVNDVPIGEDGTFELRENERLSLSYLITDNHIGDKVKFKIFRDGNTLNKTLTLVEFMPIVPYPKTIKKPPYIIFGGLVFSKLTTDYLRGWGGRWWEKSPLDLKYYFGGRGRLNIGDRDSLVILINVLPDQINVGYHEKNNEIVKSVNEIEVTSFNQFIELLKASLESENYTKVEFENNSKIILSNDQIKSTAQELIDRNNISKPYSDDVAEMIQGSL